MQRPHPPCGAAISLIERQNSALPNAERAASTRYFSRMNNAVGVPLSVLATIRTWSPFCAWNL